MDKDYDSPKYKIVYNIIKQRINDGHYISTNNQIPDELSLCKEFKSSRMTIKKALDLLVAEGLIYRKRGLGSFVLYKNRENSSVLQIYDQELAGFSEITDNTCTTKVLDLELIFADETLASKLGVSIQEPLYKFVRLRSIDSIPFSIETFHMSTRIVPSLNIDYLNNSFFTFIDQNLENKIVSSQRILRACISTDIDIKYLQLQADEPVLEIEDTIYLSNGSVLALCVIHYVYNKVEFTTYAQRK